MPTDPQTQDDTIQPPPSRRLRGALFLALGAFAMLPLGWLALRIDGATAESLAPLTVSRGAVAATSPFPKQGPNECGAYSLALGIRLASGQAVEPQSLVRKLSNKLAWSEGLSGTLPWSLVGEARRRGLANRAYSALNVEPARRLDSLRLHLAKGRPVVLLIESERGFQHYVLALGFGPDRIDLYDPNFGADPKASATTLDSNGLRPGNRSLSASELTDLWSRGGLLGLFGWWYLPLRGPSADHDGRS